MLASLMFFTGCEKVDETKDSSEPSSLIGLFSVSAERQVCFAPGNLEYGVDYHFAEHQYDCGGYFGWGTGGTPTLTSTDYLDYPTFDDWGSYIDGDWRTLTYDEWRYVIFERDSASAKCGAATVCGVHGMILLPDNHNIGTFHAGFNGWSTNVYDASSWSDMEDAGAVFLPAAGYRHVTELRNVEISGGYWSSTPYCEYGACDLDIDDDYVDVDGSYSRGLGLSVRLVKNI